MIHQIICKAIQHSHLLLLTKLNFKIMINQDYPKLITSNISSQGSHIKIFVDNKMSITTSCR